MLAVTDLFVGFITQPSFAVTLISYIVKLNFFRIYAEKVNGAFSFSLCMISILASSAISVEGDPKSRNDGRWNHGIAESRKAENYPKS